MTIERSETKYDLIVVGGGLAGILSAVRVARDHPELSILMLEKDEFLGGRLRSSKKGTAFHSFGLKGVSEELFNYWNQVMKEDPSGNDLPHFKSRKMTRMGVLAAGKVKELPYEDVFGVAGAKLITGGAGVRDWKHIDKLEDARKNKQKSVTQSFAKAFGGTKKSPSAIVLSHLSHLWGIPDLWAAQAQLLLDRAECYQSAPYVGDWLSAMTQLIEGCGANQIEVKTSSRVISASYDDKWHVRSERGEFHSDCLIVAMPIWEAGQWLPRSEMPQCLAGLATRTTPSSLVVLSDTLDHDVEADLPDVLLIPAEGVQVMIHEREICFQATLEFEQTMQAQAVVKAVKRLKRARKKFLAAYSDLEISGDHLALIPVGWAQPVGPGDQRFLEKMKDFQAEHLMFCGDSYGSSTLGDQNFLNSVSSICHTLSQSKV